MSLTKEDRDKAVQTLFDEARKHLPTFTPTDQRGLVLQMDQMAFTACNNDQNQYFKKLSALWGKAKRKASAAPQSAGARQLSGSADPSLPGQANQGATPSAVAGGMNLSGLTAEQQMLIRRQTAQQARQHGAAASQSGGYNAMPASSPWQQPQASMQPRQEMGQAGQQGHQMRNGPSYPMSQDQLQASIANLTGRNQHYPPQAGMAQGNQMQTLGQPAAYAYARQAAVSQGMGYPPQQRANPSQSAYPQQAAYQHKAMTASHAGSQSGPGQMHLQNQRQGLPYASRPSQAPMSQQGGNAATNNYMQNSTHAQQAVRQQQHAFQQSRGPVPGGGNLPPLDYLQHARAGPSNVQYQSAQQSSPWAQQQQQPALVRQQHGQVPQQQPLGQQYPAHEMQQQGQAQQRGVYQNMPAGRAPDPSSLQPKQHPQQFQVRQPGQAAAELHAPAHPATLGSGGASGDYGILPASPSMQQMIHGLILNRPEPQQQQQAAAPAMPKPSAATANPSTNTNLIQNQALNPQSRQYGHQDQYGQARYQEPQARQGAMPALPRPTQAAQMGARQLPQASQQMAPPQWPAQPSRALAPAPAAWAQPAQNQVQPGSYMDMLNGTAPATSQAPPWQMQSMPHMGVSQAMQQRAPGGQLQTQQPGQHQGPQPVRDATTEQYWKLLDDMQRNLVPILEPFLNRLKLNDSDDPNQKKFLSIKTQILPRLKINRSNPHYTHRTWTQKHVDQLLLLQKQLSAYATKCLQHDERLRQAMQPQAAPLPGAAAPSIHQRPPPGLPAFPPGAAAQRPALPEVELRRQQQQLPASPSLLQPQNAPEGVKAEVAAGDLVQMSAQQEVQLKSFLPSKDRQERLFEASTQFAAVASSNDFLPDRQLDGSKLLDTWNVPDTPGTLQSSPAASKISRKRMSADMEQVEADQQRDNPLLLQQLQNTQKELQMRCNQMDAGSLQLKVLPKAQGSSAAWTVQMSPADSAVSSQTATQNAALTRSNLAPEGSWQTASFELVDDRTLEVRNALFCGSETSDIANHMGIAAQDHFHETMASKSCQPSLQVAVTAWNSAVDHTLQPSGPSS